MSGLAVCYAFDDRLRQAANAEGRNYWYAYVVEVLSGLGVCPRPVALDACANAASLTDTGVLVLGNFRASRLPPEATVALSRWVEAGGILIGFATEGLDDLFGVTGEGTVEQAADPFAISGYLAFRPSALTQDCRAPVDPEQRLIVISPIRRLRCGQAEPLADLFACDPGAPGDGRRARRTDSPAITGRRLGCGHAFTFAFDLAQTLWCLQQGRPVDRDYDGDGYLRYTDASVIGDNSRRVPYADALKFLLMNMIGQVPAPMIHFVPPRAGRVAPALLYFGGDDECDPGSQVPASDFMAERGLPYHINAMPLDGRFAISPEEQARIEANGHEIALHYNFIDGFEHPGGFTREDVLAQARLFRERFGRDSVCGVTHWFRWCGWAEPARWMREAGGLADNSFSGWTSPPLNPINTIGFMHGSAFPRHIWDDAEHGNARIDLLELPVVAYEVGYLEEAFHPEMVRDALELAVRYHLTLNLFWHPVYIAQYPACRRAIDELVRLMGDMPVPPVLMGPDALARWWAARARASIEDVQWTNSRLAFRVRLDHDVGFVVKVPTGARPPEGCSVDGAASPFECAREFGGHWAFIPLASGAHRIELDL